jgi:hypothetical protein
MENVLQEEEKRKAFNRGRLMTLLFLESAVRLRQAWVEEEVEEFMNTADATLKSNAPSLTRHQGRQAQKSTQEAKKFFATHQQQLDRQINAEITRLLGYLSPKAMEAYENTVSVFNMCADELTKAKSKKNVLALIKMYNQGLFDNVFEELEKPDQPPQTTEA